MFLHIFKYKLKTLIMEKEGLFWTLFFPVILSTLFYFAFGNLNASEKMEKVNISLVESSASDTNFTKALEDTNMFNIQKTSADEAKKLLSDGKISGYISNDDGIKLTVKKTGLQESIINSVLDQYAQINSTVNTVFMLNPQGNITELMGTLQAPPEYLERVPVSETNNTNVVYFYALLAMTCLSAATFGAYDVTNIQANQSQRAARLSVSPTHKLKIFLASICGTIVFQFVSILIVLAYMSGILNVDFGNSMGYVVMMCLVSTFMGVTMGTAIGSLMKAKENVKIAIISSFCMVCCFLAGMMSADVKYIVQSKFPPISYINPANLITDGFLSLYYYKSPNQYFLSLGILAGFSVIFSAITYLVLRRQKYASI